MIDFIKDIQDCLFAVKDSEIYKSYYMNHVYEMDCEIHNLDNDRDDLHKKK